MLAPNPQMAAPEPPDDQPAPQFHDVTISRKRKRQLAKVMGVPPEEFGISRNARSLRECGYCFHEVLKTEAELLDDGYNAEQVKALPTYTMLQNPEELSRDTVDEHLSAGGDEGINSANRLLKITEHYIRMDYEGKGKVALYRVTTGADQGEVLKRDGEYEIVQEDEIPFAAMTPVIVTHRFFGRSVADLVMDIQRIKTALIRGVLDNAYMVNSPRTEVAESHASDNTLDDLLVSRPNGIVRTKMPGGLNQLVTPPIGAALMPVIEYMDATREWRTGVSRAGQGLDANALQNQSATAANQLFTAAQARMKLIARIFAETGIRDLFSLLHSTIRKHGSQAQTVRLRNQWVDVDPREWKSRNDMTINVGLGTGSKAEQLGKMMQIVSAQKELLLGGKTNIVGDEQLYNSAKELSKLAGQKNPDMFFTDPKGKPPPQAAPDPKMMEIQAKAENEKMKIAADAEHQKLKFQAESTLEQQKFEHERELARMNMSMAQDKHQHDKAIAVVKTVMSGAQHKDGTGKPIEHPMLGPVKELVTQLTKANAPRRVVRDHNNRPIGLEPATT